MKLNNWGGLVFAAVAVLGCASGPNPADNSTLSVYDNNKVGYTIASSGSTTPTRVWSTNDTILALRFGAKLVNAKDIESVSVTQTNKKNVPLNILVKLTSGESLAADVSDWGNRMYSDTLVEWLACNRQKICDYLDRTGGINFQFKQFGNFLASFNDARLSDVVQQGRAVDQYLSYRLYDALPSSSGRYYIKFGDAAKISDLSDGIAAEHIKADREKKCITEAAAKERRMRKEEEERIIRTTPPEELDQQLRRFRASLDSEAALSVAFSMQCKS